MNLKSRKILLCCCLMLWPQLALADFLCQLGQHLQSTNKEAVIAPEYRTFLASMDIIRHPEIPLAAESSLVRGYKPEAVEYPGGFGAGLKDPLIERARELKVFEDFKPWSDARSRNVTETELQRAFERAKAAAARVPENQQEAEFLKRFLPEVYELTPNLLSPKGLADAKWRLAGGEPELRQMFRFIEESWNTLLRHQPKDGQLGSLLPMVYPFFIPAGRFQEGYYWDTYPVVMAMVKTGRLNLAHMQVENMFAMVRKFGLVPNGWRQYYLSRSQPPMLSSMTREVYAASLRSSEYNRTEVLNWLRARAMPALMAEYQGFWMSKRFNQRTGLNFHSDAINLPRPERHGADNELEIGNTYRATRAGAESGRDFTATLGRDVDHVHGVLLNAVMYKVETDLAFFARELGDQVTAQRMEQAASNRQQAMNRYLWNAEAGRYENYNFVTGQRISLNDASNAYALWAGVAENSSGNPQAQRILASLTALERRGGLMSSEVMDSKGQWDGAHGWPPDHLVAVLGAERYGFNQFADRLANKWLDTNIKIYRQHGTLPESVDVLTQDIPAPSSDRYPTVVVRGQPFAWNAATCTVMALRNQELEAAP